MRFSLLVCAPIMALGSGNAAINKVVEMLKEMETRGKEEKQAEARSFAAFKTWCDNTQSNKATEIKDTEVAIEAAEAKALNAQAKAAAAQEQIDEEINTQKETKEANDKLKTVRSNEAEAYAKENNDLSDSIYACEKAIEALSAVPDKVEANKGEKAVQSFLQTSRLNSKQSPRLSAVRSLLETVQAAENPFTAASERRSDTVIKMLGDLKVDFEEQKQKATRDEAQAKHTYDMTVQANLQTIENSERKQAEQEKVKSENEEISTKAKQEHTELMQSLADSKSYLASVKAECDVKSKDFASRQASRTKELEAIAQALNILESDIVTTGAAHLSKAQTVGSFLQLRGNNDAQENVLKFLRSRASSLHSQTLMQLAEVAGADPFAKIRSLISALLARLREEAKNELTKKGQCDKDMAENKANIEEFTEKVETATAEVQTLTADVAADKEKIKELDNKLAELRKESAKAKTDRITEKAENEKVIEESQLAVTALDQAMAALQTYFASTKSAFLQSKQQPDFAAGEYKPQDQGGVIGLLEVVKSQTEDLIRETQSAEANAARLHGEFLTKSESSIAESDSELKSRQVSLAQNEENLIDTKNDLDGPEGFRVQLNSYQKLKTETIDPACTVQGVSFEERNAKRKEEIQSLEEALNILSQMAA